MQRMLWPALVLAIFISAFVYFEPTNSPAIQERNVRAHIEFLASDALQGRGSGIEYELIAAQYIASQLRQFGIEPAGDLDANVQKTFLQTVTVTKQAFIEAPKLVCNLNGKTIEWAHGKEMVLMRASAAEINGPCRKSPPARDSNTARSCFGNLLRA